MNFSPKPLEFAPGVWSALMANLRLQGKGRRESGAFLLARNEKGDDVVRTWLSYSQIAPESLNYAYIRLEPEAFASLADWCSHYGVKVVADIHTHPFGPCQSLSDRANPMISFPGHVALIVPWFAQRNPQPRHVSFNVYQGDGRWLSFYERAADALITIS
jgi:proteasome lid subunit RPN8/RPN11